jgi:CBS domain-containing protein
MTIAAILKHKGQDILSVAPEHSIADAAHLLATHRIGAAPVRNAGGQLLGIISERDIVRALANHGAAALALTVAALMTRELTIATPRTTVQEAMELMTAGRFRHLPVIEGGRLVGIVSIGDIVKTRLEQQAQEVDSLKAYVAGGA